jgi:hypothetical protein
VKISALNTVFTVLCLMVILPSFGVHLPIVKVLLPLTFVAGLLPVVGIPSMNVVVFSPQGSVPVLESLLKADSEK